MDIFRTFIGVDITLSHRHFENRQVKQPDNSTAHTFTVYICSQHASVKDTARTGTTHLFIDVIV